MSQSTTPAGPLTTPTRVRLVDQVVEILTDAVVSGRFPPGSTLPPERQLAEQLEVNRTSLRQALSRMEDQGLVASRQGSGTVVLDPVENPDPRVMSRLIAHADPALVAELFEVRTGIVGMAARLAAERAGPEDADRLRAALDDVAATTSPAELQAAEMTWFGRLVEASHNRALILLVRWVERAYEGASAPFEAAFRNLSVVVQGLDAVVTAVGAGRADDAEQAMLAYAATSGALMLAAFEDDRGADGT